MGDLGKRLFEPSLSGEFPLDAQQGEQRRRKAVAGWRFLWFLSFWPNKRKKLALRRNKTFKLYKN